MNKFRGRKQANKNPKHVDKTLDLFELEDSIREVCDNKGEKLRSKGNNKLVKQLGKVSGTSTRDWAKQCGDRSLSVGPKVDSSKIRKLTLSYDPEVDTFGNRILKIDSTSMTYEEAFEISAFVDKALDLQDASKHGIPIEFTQFVLRKLAVDETDCCSFVKALHHRARKCLMSIIELEKTEKYEVHPANYSEPPSIFRHKFTRLFCQKVIANLENVNYEHEKLNQLPRVFPFQVRKNVPEYKIDIDILQSFDDRFYDRMQAFLDQHFDENVSARETIVLFVNNIRYFFDTKFSSKEQSAEYLRTFPRLNDKGISRFQYVYREYGNVQKHFCVRKLRVPHLHNAVEDFRTIPEKNFDEMAFLLRPVEFRTKFQIYAKTFKKYLFFFVHALEIEDNPTPIFFIDDVLFQCLKSLRRFRTLRQDVNIVDDIAMITLLHFLDYKKEVGNNDRYTIELTKLGEIKRYISNFVTENNSKFYQQYSKGLFCELTFRVNNEICFDAGYSSKKNNCQRGIMHLYHQLVCSALSPDDEPITNIVCYSAYLGREDRFAISRDIVEWVRNFVRLSTKTDISRILREPVHNVFLEMLRDRLVILS